jgi:hypothetical protein
MTSFNSKNNFISISKYFIGVGLLMLLAGLIDNNFSINPGWDFRNELWGPANLALNGQSPYNIKLLFAETNAIWLPMVIGTFLPLGWLPLSQASIFWGMLNIIALVLIVWLASNHARPPIFMFTVTLLLSFIFPPIITHITLGQISILICLLFIIISNYKDSLSPQTLAFLFAFSLTKPQLGLFVLPGFIYAYFRNNGHQKTIRFLIYLGLAIGILSLPLFVLYPAWLGDFIFNLTHNNEWAHPSLGLVLAQYFNNFGKGIWILLIMAGFITNFWIWKKLPTKQAMLWSLALTPLLSPYIWSWDFVLLLPLFISFLFQNTSNSARWIGIGGYIVMWAIVINMKLSGDISDHSLWWVSWWLIILVGFGILINRNSSRIPQNP